MLIFSMLPLLITSFIASGYLFHTKNIPCGVLFLGVYALLSLISMLNWRSLFSRREHPLPDTAAQNNPPKFGILWHWILPLAGLLFFSGQGMLLWPETFLNFKNTLVLQQSFTGLGLCFLGLSLLLGYLFSKSKYLFVSATFFKRLFFIITLSAYSFWTYKLILKSVSYYQNKIYFCLFDDAMISLRYAWNLVQGHGLVWNIGERVEGYTNLLMVLFMSIGAFLFDKNYAVLFTHVSGGVFIILIAWLNYAIAKTVLKNIPEERRPLYLGLAFVAPFLYYPLNFWSLFGMETGLLGLIVSGATLIVLHHSGKPKLNLLFPVLGGLLVLTRPDAIIQVGILFAYRLYCLWSQKTKWSQISLLVLTEFMLFIIFPIAQLIFRHHYYGEWLPNTYLLKMTGLPVKIRIISGLAFVVPFVISIAWPLLFGILGIFFKLNKAKVLLMLLLLSALGYQAYVGGDPWPYWRIMAPYLPMLLILSLAGIDGMINSSLGWFKRIIPPALHTSNLVVILTLLLWLSGLAYANIKFAPELFLKKQPYTTFYNAGNVHCGLFLAEYAKPEAMIAVTWAGTIPYYSGLKGVDCLGKCDKYIANLEPQYATNGFRVLSTPGHNKFDYWHSLIKRNPDAIHNFQAWGGDLTPHIHANYVFKNNNVWLRKDSPYFDWERVEKAP